MTDKAFFRREGETFVPLPPARGFWSDDSIHGSAVTGLIASEIERRHGTTGMIPARFNADLHRMARLRPVTVETRVIRDSTRLRLVEASLLCEGEELARAQCQFLRPAEHPAGRVWPGVPGWSVPAPETLPPDTEPFRMGLAEWRLISGDFGTYGPRQMWLRQFATVIAGEPMSPFVRVAVMADFSSPWLHSADTGIVFINTDVVVQLHRLPEDEWVGLEAMVHDGSQGIAVGACRLYDQAGSIGFVNVTGLANTRR